LGISGVGVLVGIGVRVEVGATVGVDVTVDVDVTIGPNNCPEPQEARRKETNSNNHKYFLSMN
jgi:hypothetical protein